MKLSARTTVLAAATVLPGLAPDAAAAYVGPGAGLSALGSILAFVGVVLLLVVGFVWYPVKRLLRRMKERRAGPETGAPRESGEP